MVEVAQSMEQTSEPLSKEWLKKYSDMGFLGINVSENFMVSYAYSYSLGNKTGVYNNGTHEIILRYNLRQVAKALIDSPRYF